MTEKLVYKRPESLLENARFTFCPGCGHGVVLKIMAELIDEFNIKTDTIAIASVGCSVFLEKFFDVDVAGASHGRSTCVATCIKRCNHAMRDKAVIENRISFVKYIYMVSNLNLE